MGDMNETQNNISGAPVAPAAPATQPPAAPATQPPAAPATQPLAAPATQPLAAPATAPADDGQKKREAEITKAILWCASLTAILTSVTLIVLLRVFGLLSLAGTVEFRGEQRSVASVQKLQQVWDALSQDFYEPVDEDRMIESAAAAMAESLGDIYTTYYTKEEMRRFSEHSAGVFVGIGVYVQPNDKGRLRITGFLDNSPALESGVLLDDEIVSVDGVDVREISDANRIIDMIKGEAGQSVTVGFFRPSEGKTIDISIERREIKTENILSRLLYIGEGGELVGVGKIDTDADGGAPGGVPIGYIYIRMFDSSAFEYFNRRLDELLEHDIAGLILDIRGNPGGDFDQTVKIADRLIGEGTIVYTEDRAEHRVYHKSDAICLGLPLRVLVDNDSASSSEILAGAVKDNGAGRLVGTTTFGKGLVQAVLVLSDKSGLKYTRARYFTPSGAMIHGIGIEPDILVEPDGMINLDIDGEAIPERDLQLEAALCDIEKVIDKAKYE